MPASEATLPVTTTRATRSPELIGLGTGTFAEGRAAHDRVRFYADLLSWQRSETDGRLEGGFSRVPQASQVS
jgi:hypothetical protein